VKRNIENNLENDLELTYLLNETIEKDKAHFRKLASDAIFKALVVYVIFTEREKLQLPHRSHPIKQAI
jgi:hypothetical protein